MLHGKFMLSLAGVFLLGVCVHSQMDWWKHAVIYQIYPKSFKDSNNDGLGDLQGVISKLDYLVDLGITAIWFSPIYKSPQVDSGYDVSDYKDIDPIFGNMTDFDELVRVAHAKGIKILMDFVPNHSSNLHQWFQNSENSVPGYEDYYVWLDGAANNTQPPNNWISYFHGPAWTYSPLRNKWYLHQFAFQMPDLNYRNPRVVQEIKDTFVFWMDRGVDGFRCDIVSALFEDPNFPDEPPDPNNPGQLLHIYTMNLPETYDMVYQWREVLDNYTATHGGEERMMMTENSTPYDEVFGWYGNETMNAAHFPFNFLIVSQLNGASNATRIVSLIDWWYRTLPTKYTSNWVMGNHDNHRIANRYGTTRVDGMNMLLLMLQGVAILYNGEEFGQEDGQVTWEQGQDPQACNGPPEDFDKNSRDFQRTPLQWDNTTNAGFNEGTAPWLPVGQNYVNINAAAQMAPGVWSHYKIYQALIQAKKTATIMSGSVEVWTFNDNVFAITRRLATYPTYVVAINIGNMTEMVDLNVFPDLPATLVVDIPGMESDKLIGDVVDSAALSLLPYEALVLITMV